VKSLEAAKDNFSYNIVTKVDHLKICWLLVSFSF